MESWSLVFICCVRGGRVCAYGRVRMLCMRWLKASLGCRPTGQQGAVALTLSLYFL